MADKHVHSWVLNPQESGPDVGANLYGCDCGAEKQVVEEEDGVTTTIFEPREECE